MVEQRNVIRVFLASPSDLSPERLSAKKICDEVNTNLANTFGFQVELIGWELTVTGFGRPQELINQDLDQCELFFGMVWKRWGHPPGPDSSYGSGFEEEYRRTLKRKNAGAKVEIGIFLKDVSPEDAVDPGDQLKKVLKFREELTTSYQIYYEVFSDEKDFEDKFRRAIYRYVRRKVKEVRYDSSGDSQSPKHDRHAEQADQGNESSILPTQIVHFFEELKSHGVNKEDINDIDSHHVARLRLVASSYYSSGNDRFNIGPHDANLIYFSLHPDSVSSREKVAYVRAGLENIENENVPFWSWEQDDREGGLDDLFFQSFFSEPAKLRVGALKALNLVGRNLPKDFFIGRERTIQSWFDDTPKDVRVAALAYLRSWGTDADLPIVVSEIEKAESGTLSQAIEANISIVLRDDFPSAVAALIELDPVSPSEKLLLAVFLRASEIHEDALIRMLSSKSDNVRLLSLKTLHSRKLVDVAMSEAFLHDSNYSVRMQAIYCLEDIGESVPLSRAKDILTPLKKNSGLGLVASRGGDEELFNGFKAYTLKRSSEATLIALTEESSLMDNAAELALYEQRFTDHKATIRSMIDDRCRAWFDKKLTSYDRILGAAAGESEKRWKVLRNHICESHLFSLLDLLCRNSDSSDLDRVRGVIDEFDCRYYRSILEFLGKYGDAIDVSRLSKLSQGWEGSNVLLDAFRGSAEKHAVAADAIFQLVGKNLRDVIELPVHNKLKCILIANVTKHSVASVTVDEGLAFLQTEEPEKRKALVLRFVGAWPKRRLRSLLDEYAGVERKYYYNVVYWLDLGISLPTKITPQITRRVLDDEWALYHSQRRMLDPHPESP